MNWLPLLCRLRLHRWRTKGNAHVNGVSIGRRWKCERCASERMGKTL